MRARRFTAILAGGALVAAGLVGFAGPAGAGTPKTSSSLRFAQVTEGDPVTVPDGVCGAFVEAWGAQGGFGANTVDEGATVAEFPNGAPGGFGGSSEGWISLEPGDDLEVRVGGQGRDGSDETGSANGGVNGGGNGAPAGSTIFGGGGGGGYSGIFADGDDLQPLIVAGGGGGGGVGEDDLIGPAVFPSTPLKVGGEGGSGSGDDGEAGLPGTLGYPTAVTQGGGGGGGTDSAGGLGGTNIVDSFTGRNGTAGSELTGGAGGGDTGAKWGYGGGGGGGLYGGGGGADATTASGGGGGGSGLVPDVDGGSETGVREGNGEVRITWTPCDVELTVTKTVTGDDPGVAFPVEVECTATFVFDDEWAPLNEDADIVVTPEEPIASATVDLKGGEEATLVVSATATLDTLDCTVTEGAATLPTGYTCEEPEYSPDSAVAFWDLGESEADAATVEVINDCTAPPAAPAAAPAAAVVAQPRFTG